MQIGDLLWYVPRDSRMGRMQAIRVAKIGRKWATLENRQRVDIATGKVDGGGCISPGKCWPSREAWEAEVVRDRAWRRFRNFANSLWNPPAGLTLEQINQLCDLLGLPKEET